MDAETLVYNSSTIEELANTTAKHLQEFSEEVEGMFDVIDNKMNQPDHWSGSIYEDLKGKCDNFRKTKIETMEANLKAYVDHFHRTSEESEETTTNVRGIVTRDAEQNANAVNANAVNVTTTNPDANSTTGII